MLELVWTWDKLLHFSEADLGSKIYLERLLGGEIRIYICKFIHVINICAYIHIIQIICIYNKQICIYKYIITILYIYICISNFICVNIYNIYVYINLPQHLGQC